MRRQIKETFYDLFYLISGINSDDTRDDIWLVAKVNIKCSRLMVFNLSHEPFRDQNEENLAHTL